MTGWVCLLSQGCTCKGDLCFLSIIGPLLAGLGLILLYVTFRGFKKDDLITNTPTSKVRSLAMGRVALYGKALPYDKKPFMTPFGQLECIWCNWSGMLSSEGTEAYIEGDYAGFFYLRDETGQVLVYTKGLKVDAGCLQDTHWNIPKYSMFLKGHNIDPTKIISPLTEYYVPPYSNVFLLGTAVRNPTLQAGTTEKHEDEIVICRGEGVFYMSTQSSDKVRKYAGANISVYLALGTALIILGVASEAVYYILT